MVAFDLQSGSRDAAVRANLNGACSEIRGRELSKEWKNRRCFIQTRAALSLLYERVNHTACERSVGRKVDFKNQRDGGRAFEGKAVESEVAQRIGYQAIAIDFHAAHDV